MGISQEENIYKANYLLKMLERLFENTNIKRRE